MNEFSLVDEVLQRLRDWYEDPDGAKDGRRLSEAVEDFTMESLRARGTGFDEEAARRAFREEAARPGHYGSLRPKVEQRPPLNAMRRLVIGRVVDSAQRGAEG